MRNLLVKEKNNNFKLYSPDTYGMDSWGDTSQDSLVKKKKHWYIQHWSAGNDWIEDTTEEYKLNVILETSDLDEIIRYVITHNNDRKLIEYILVEAQNIYTDYINFSRCMLKNY